MFEMSSLFPFMLFLLIVPIPNYNSGKSPDNKLQAVVIVFRHGERSPQYNFPNNPYQNRSTWKTGPGQLLNKGKERMYNLGKWLRKRYTNFLPELYSETDIRISSTNYDRTLMSAELLAAGLYPPRKHQVWHKSLDWQPIPIHPAPEELLRSEITKTCPKYTNLWNKYIKSEPFQKKLQQYRGLINHVTQQGGFSVLNIKNFLKVADSLMIAYHLGMPLPQWASNMNMTEVANTISVFFESLAATDELLRLMVGGFFENLIKYFESFQEDKDKVKFVALSGHDSNLAAILSGLNAYTRRPSYGSMILMELRRIGDGKRFVNIFHKGLDNFRQIRITGCDLDCGLQEFIENFKAIRVAKDQFWEECFEVPFKEELRDEL